MMIPNLGNVENWVLVGHGDAGIKSLPDKMTSCGGQVILLCNDETDKCCVLLWRSKKIIRKAGGAKVPYAGANGSGKYLKVLVSWEGIQLIRAGLNQNMQFLWLFEIL
jgi:hypothetical protein